MYTDLFVHQLTHLIQAMGVRFPRRVVGGGGLYLEYDGRDVPDVATVVADYDEGCQVIVTATMANDHPIEEVIRGHTATIKFAGDGFDILPQKLANRPGTPNSKQAEAAEHISAPQPELDTLALWEHFLECIRSRNPETLCPAETGYAAIATVNLGVQSYREGKALYFDKETGKVSEADESWAKKWEKMSQERAKPNQVMGWHAGDDRLAPRPPRLPEARRRLGRRQGPRRRGLSPASQPRADDNHRGRVRASHRTRPFHADRPSGSSVWTWEARLGGSPQSPVRSGTAAPGCPPGRDDRGRPSHFGQTDTLFRRDTSGCGGQGRLGPGRAVGSDRSLSRVDLSQLSSPGENPAAN